MGTVSVPSSTLCLISGVANWDNCFLDRKRLEPKELLWQHHWGRHFVYFDIVYPVFYHFQLPTTCRHNWSNLHNRKTSISLKRKKIFQKEKRHSYVFWKAFQMSRKYFSVICTSEPYLNKSLLAFLLETKSSLLSPKGEIVLRRHSHWASLSLRANSSTLFSINCTLTYSTPYWLKCRYIRSSNALSLVVNLWWAMSIDLWLLSLVLINN